MSSMSEFGREIGLMHQIIMHSKRLGADERFWKSLVKSEESLTSMIDFAMFYHPPRIGFCLIAEGGTRDFSLLCLSQSVWVSHEEAILRIERFGRFASDGELELLCQKFQELWDAADCPALQYPIVACAKEDIERHTEYFLAITYGENGRPTLTKCDTEKQREYAGTPSSFHWAPGTMFMALARPVSVRKVLGSRLRQTRQSQS